MRQVFLLIFLSTLLFASEENFILLDNTTSEVIFQLGPHLDKRVTPCSTFKLPLCLIGFDAGILQDANLPKWDYQEGYDDYLESWKVPHTPLTWIQHSCVWYSRLLIGQLGSELIQDYVTSFDYGNKEIHGPRDLFWISSSLKISPLEQVIFIQKMLLNKLDLSRESIALAKPLFYQGELHNGWKLFGKTGFGIPGDHQIGWFVGWIENGQHSLSFAYNILDTKIDLSQRIPRVKQLLRDSASNVYDHARLFD